LSHHIYNSSLKYLYLESTNWWSLQTHIQDRQYIYKPQR